MLTKLKRGRKTVFLRRNKNINKQKININENISTPFQENEKCSTTQILQCLPPLNNTSLTEGDSVIIIPDKNVYTLTIKDGVLQWIYLGTFKGDTGQSISIINSNTLPPIDEFDEGDEIILIPSNQIYILQDCEWVCQGSLCNNDQNQIFQGNIINPIYRPTEDDNPLPNPNEYNVGDIIFFSTSGNIYTLDNNMVWMFNGSLKGDQGEIGETGDTGLSSDNIDIIESESFPPIIGYTTGDIILLKPSDELYQLTENNIWQYQGSLRGEPGRNPNTITKYNNPSGLPPPSNSGYSIGDMVLVMPSGNIYTFNGSTWLYGGNIKGERGDPSNESSSIRLVEGEYPPSPINSEYNEGDIVITKIGSNVFTLTRNQTTGQLYWQENGTLAGNRGEPGNSNGDDDLFYFDSIIDTTDCNKNILFPTNSSLSPTDKINFVIKPKGNGSFQLSTERNCRGINSVDLQINSSVNPNVPKNEQVASGNYSFLGNSVGSNVSSHLSANCGGYNNSVTTGNNPLNSYNFNGGGINNIISGEYNFNVGGGKNIISGNNNFNGAGGDNIIEGNNNTNLGGRNNKIINTSENSINYGGTNNTIDGSFNINSGDRNIINLNYNSNFGGSRIKINGNYNTNFGGKNININGNNNNTIGGLFNNIGSDFSNILGGERNTNNASFSNIISGNENTITYNGSYSSTLGGNKNKSNAQKSVCIGGEGLESNVDYVVTLGKYNRSKQTLRPDSEDASPTIITNFSGTYNSWYESTEGIRTINNDFSSNVSFVIGNGTENERRDIFLVNQLGCTWTRGTYACSFADIAEIYLCDDEKKPNNGTLMTVNEKGIVHAYKKGTNEKVLGIISSDPMLIGNMDALFTKYLRDEETGLILKDENNNPILKDDINENEYPVTVGIKGRVIMKKKYIPYILDKWIVYNINMEKFVMVQIT